MKKWTRGMSNRAQARLDDKMRQRHDKHQRLRRDMLVVEWSRLFERPIKEWVDAASKQGVSPVRSTLEEQIAFLEKEIREHEQALYDIHRSKW